MKIWVIETWRWEDNPQYWDKDIDLGLFASPELAQAKVDELHAEVVDARRAYEVAVRAASEAKVRKQAEIDEALRGTGHHVRVDGAYPARPHNYHNAYRVSEETHEVIQ